MNELYHYGIKGMKWGVRRYQNKDGTLTPRGRKRISKEYKKESAKAINDLQRKRMSIQVDAYNKAADAMNKGGIDEFNKEQEKKYGKDFAKRDGYTGDYMAKFTTMYEKNYDEMMREYANSNKNYQKAKELCQQYDMTSWDEFAKKNAENIKRFESLIGYN